MTRTSLLLLVAVTVVLCEDIPPPATLLADPARLDSLLACAGGKQESCESWAKNVTDYIPEALKNGCAACPEPQKDFIRELTLHLKNNDPDKYQAMIGQLDKDGNAEKEAFLKFLQSTD